MATDTQWVTNLLDEAAAIVEAEWIRLRQDRAQRERGVADLFSELLAPRRSPPRVGVTTTQCGRSGPMPEDCGGRPARRWPPMQVWATQRSPPPSRETY
jgi:hypothetical protein